MTLTTRTYRRNRVSHELTSYPKELLSSPADTSTASLRVRPGGPALPRRAQDAPAASVLPRGADRWTRALDYLVARHDLTVGFAALALLIAIALGRDARARTGPRQDADGGDGGRPRRPGPD